MGDLGYSKNTQSLKRSKNNKSQKSFSFAKLQMALKFNKINYVGSIFVKKKILFSQVCNRKFFFELTLIFENLVK